MNTQLPNQQSAPNPSSAQIQAICAELESQRNYALTRCTQLVSALAAMSEKLAAANTLIATLEKSNSASPIAADSVDS